MLIEVCVDRVQSAVNAVSGGADRIELCQDLAIGGTTPSEGLVIQTMRAIDKPIVVMIRTRGGDFCYDEYEFEVMMEDIQRMRELQVAGIVTGMLSADGGVDKKRMQQVMEAAKGMEVVFHRAFDMTKNLSEALDDLSSLGITRVLTSGGMNLATEGIDNLKKLVQKQSPVTIMAGSGISAENVKLFEAIGIREIHLSGKTQIPSKMLYRNPSVQMGKSDARDEYIIEETQTQKIRAVRKIFE